MAGNTLFPGSETAAHCYCGYQFGHFSGQLGDGAAIYLGEVRLYVCMLFDGLWCVLLVMLWDGLWCVGWCFGVVFVRLCEGF